MKKIENMRYLLGILVMMFLMGSTQAAPVTGFTGEFAPANWEIGSNPASPVLVNTSGAPESVSLSNHAPWASSGSGFTFGKKHVAGTVSFRYSFGQVTSNACPFSYSVGTEVTVLSYMGSAMTSFPVDENESFGFALNGNNTATDFACQSASQQTITVTVSDFVFTPSESPTSVTVGQVYDGGIVAYIYQSGDPGYSSSATNGFVVTSGDINEAQQWGSLKTTQGVFPCANAELSALGDGGTNTANIITANADATGPYANSYAAKTASDYGADWVLPSKDELAKIYANRAVLGSFASPTNWYWSSTEYTCQAGAAGTYPQVSSYAYGQNFSTGDSQVVFKKTGYAVRAIKYFSIP